MKIGSLDRIRNRNLDMSATLRTDETFRVTVTAASPAAPLAILFIAGKLGIEPARVAEQLVSLPAVLAEALPDQDARRMAAMLSLMGVQVRLDPALSIAAPPPDLAEMALQLAEGADRVAVVTRLQRVLGPDAELAGLDQAGGLVLAGMRPDERRQIARALRRAAGLRITVSDPDTAVYDLFARRTPRLASAVSQLGLAACRFSGAVATGVNRATGRVLLGRAGPGALLIDRAFQRFDLVLHAAPGLMPADLAAFLETRPGVDLKSPDGTTGARLDADLSRESAIGFAADYAAIGIEVRARLRGRVPETR
jgi:hypothetical protein